MKVKALITTSILSMLALPCLIYAQEGNERQKEVEIRKEYDQFSAEVIANQESRDIEGEVDYDYYLGGSSIGEIYAEATEFPPTIIQPIEFLDQYPEEVARVLAYIGGIPVISSPYIGERTPFDASHLITNFPKTRLDENLLIQRQNIEDFLIRSNIPITDRPFIDISGDLEIFGFINSRDNDTTLSQIDISEIEIDIISAINSWVSGFVAILVDASPAQEGGPVFFDSGYPTTSAGFIPGDAPAILNSNVFFEVGFATVGNLNRSPFFATVGQIYVPFGRYVNYMFTTSLTRVIGRTKARAISLNYRSQADSGVYGSLYGFDGETGPGRNGTIGGNISYYFATEKATGEIGGGAISNMGDSFQGLLRFAGFGANEFTLRLDHQVPALNFYGRLNAGKFGLFAEYVGGVERFAERDLGFNGEGAKLQAWNSQIAYFFEMLGRPSSFAFAYEGTTGAYALGIPENRFGIAYNTSIWRNTVQTIEVRRDINYPAGTTGNGPIRFISGDIPTIFGSAGAPTIFGSAEQGRSATVLNILMGVYY